MTASPVNTDMRIHEGNAAWRKIAARSAILFWALLVYSADAWTAVPRSSYIRFDFTPTEVVYDPVRKLLFASFSQTNRIDVISAVDLRKITSFSVPQPMGMDMTSDRKLIIGSGVEMIYSIDPDTLKLDRIPFPVTGSAFGTLPQRVAGGGNRSVFLVLKELGVDAADLLQWFPASGEMRYLAFGVYGATLRRSADYSRTVVGNGKVYDAASDRTISVETVFLSAFNPNGSQSAVFRGSKVVFLDRDFKEMGSVETLGQFDSSPPLLWNSVYSPDGALLYVLVQLEGNPVLLVIDARKFTMIGRVPAGSSAVERLVAVDDNKQVFMIANSGLAIIDASSPRDLPGGGPLLSLPLALSPTQGRIGEETRVQLRGYWFREGAEVYFGSVPATDVVVESDTSIRVTAPASYVPGPVPVAVVFRDGWSATAPDAFTYGPYILHVTPSIGSPGGGTRASVIGFGLDAPIADIDVRVAGEKAVVLGVTPFVTGLISSYGKGVPLHEIKIRIPPGNPGSADLTVTTPAGTATLAAGFEYLKSIRVVPSESGTGRLIYDTRRRRIYLEKVDSIAVYSIDTGNFLASIIPPTLGGRRRLAGITLTPDASLLIVANFEDKSVCVINPDDPGGGVAIPAIDPSDTFQDPRPLNVAATSTGRVLITVNRSGSTNGGLRELDLSTLTITNHPTPFSFSDNVSMSSSGDGRRVFFGVGSRSNGNVFVWDPDTDKFRLTRAMNPGVSSAAPGIVEMLAAPDAQRVAVGQVGRIDVLDERLDLVTTLTDSDLLLKDMRWLLGNSMHNSGDFLYVPTETGVSIWDVNSGSLWRNVDFSVSLDASSRALAIDESGQLVYAITPTGLLIAELNSAPLGIGFLKPNRASTQTSTEVMIRGSGFRPGAEITVGSVRLASTFVDGNNLKVTIPAGPAGSTRVTVSNPDGANYSLDSAITFGTATEPPVSFALPAKGGFYRNTSGTSSVFRPGYVSIVPASSAQSVSGLAIVSLNRGNSIVSETSVPASRPTTRGRMSTVVATAELSRVRIGLALTNPSSEPATVSFYMTNADGVDYVRGTTTISPRGQLTRFLDELPFGADYRVATSFTFSSSTPLAAVALRGCQNERGDFLMTTVPILDLSTPSTAVGMLPQFADGGGWATQMTLVNPTDLRINGTVQLFDQAGLPLNVALNGRTASTFSYSLAPHAAQQLQSSGLGSVVLSGWVKVVPDTNAAPPSAFAIFSYRAGEIVISEAGVSSQPTASAGRVYVEQSPSLTMTTAITTGFAIANPGDTAVSVNLELMTLSGSNAGRTAITIPARGRISKFLNEIPGFDYFSFQGYVRVSTTAASGVAMVGLRAHYRENGEFLLAAVPAIPEGNSQGGELFIPYFVDGGGYTTQLFFLNESTSAVPASMSFFLQSGAPFTPEFER
jgi:IPT/TIG domain